jgi:WD40 repeat protein
MSAAWSPDGRRLAVGTFNGQLFLTTAGGQREGARPAAQSSWPYCLAWSPDGRLIASGSRDAIRIWQADGLTKVEEFSLPDLGWRFGGPFVLRMAWARSGGFLATNGKDDVIRLWDVRHLMPRRAASRVSVPSHWVPNLPENDGHGLGLIRVKDRGSALPFPGLALAPDGTRMFVGYENKTLGCWDLRSATEVWTYDQPVGAHVAVSRDGQRLATYGGVRR